MKLNQLTLAISQSLCLLSISSMSVASTSEPQTLETLVITANRTVEQKFSALAAVDSFNREQIEQLQAASVLDVLQQVAGISIVQQGTAAHQNSVFIRGSNSNHVLVLVNGVRVGSATLGTKDLASIPVALIERIEIVRGPRAALWGADAMGGVIQLFTRSLTSNSHEVSAQLSSHNGKQLTFATGLGNEQHSYTLAGVVESNNGYDVVKPRPNSWTVNQPDADGFVRRSLSLNGQSQFNDMLTVETMAQVDQGTVEIDNAWGGDETSYNNHLLQLRGLLLLDNQTITISGSSIKDSNEDNAKALGLAPQNSVFSTQRQQLSAASEHNISADTQITWGFDWYREKVNATTDYTITQRHNTAIFVTARQQLEQLKLEAALRRDAISHVDTKITYQLAAGYELNPQWLVALNHGSAFKAPTFNDLYYPYSGNPDLKPETAINTELLTRYSQPHYQLEVAVFRTHYDNLIIWEPDSSGMWTPLNASPLVKGAETTLTAQWQNTQHRLTLSHIDAENDQNQQQLLRRPYFAATYQLNAQFDALTLGVNINLNGGRYDIEASQRKRLGAYTLVDLTAEYQLNPATIIQAKVSNALDKRYETAVEYPADDRGFQLGLRYQF